MRKVYISKGSRIQTIDGFIEMEVYDGHRVCVISYIIKEDGTEQQVGERWLTLSEIANEMHQVDGKVRKVIWYN